MKAFLSETIWTNSKFVRAARIFLLLLCISVGIYSGSNPYSLEVAVGMHAPPKTSSEVYYAFKDEVFLPDNSRVMYQHEDGVGTVFTIKIFSKQPIKTLRFDPSTFAGAFELRFMELRAGDKQLRLDGANLGPIVRAVDQLTLLPIDGSSQKMLATGNDSKIIIPLPEAVTPTHAERLLIWLWILGLGVFFTALIELIVVLTKPGNAFRVACEKRLDRLAAMISEDATVRFSRSAILVLMVIVILASVWIGLKLNQSSVGMWDSMYPAQQLERRVDFGDPKAIRSDEWSVFTPWTFNQVETGMRNDNPNMGAPGSPVLTGAPVGGLLMLAQPKYWGFLAFDLDRGFSWMWATKAFGLITAFFLLMLAITKGDTLISLATALGVYGSSFMQWWYSSIEPEVVTGFSVAVLGTIYLLQARKTGGMLFGAILVAMAVPNLLLHLYPPYLVPLAYLSVFLLLGILLNRSGIENFLYRIKARRIFLAMVFGLWVVFVGRWYLDARDTITAMMNTVYPGDRFSMAGDMSIPDIFYGVFESWKVNEDSIPFSPANPSEVSRVWLLFPIALLLIPFRAWRRPEYRVIVWLMVFCAVSLFWAAGPELTPMRTVMAHAGWYMSPAARGILGLGLASTIMMGFLVSGVARGELVFSKRPTALLALAAFAIVMAMGFALQARDPEFFILPRLLLGATAVAGFVWAVHNGNRWLYFALTVVVALPTLTVNPLQSGLDAYFNKGIFLSAKKSGSGPNDLWAVFGDTHLAQGFKSSGLNVLNGTHYAPRLQLMQILDPQRRYANVWNRYAHIGLVKADAGESPVFELKFADAYEIQLDVCGDHIRAAGVTRVAYTKPPSAGELKCLILIPTDDQSGVSLFRLNAR